ncbi:MAG: hypothetical protein B7Z37_08530 [Verrucomicrobia bacterium 12-59-8]|nr:MAG: hypothetical protein B7Z37_08530 [Verrucomicrobia bacterium 12-59-8]
MTETPLHVAVLDDACVIKQAKKFYPQRFPSTTWPGGLGGWIAVTTCAVAKRGLQFMSGLVAGFLLAGMGASGQQPAPLRKISVVMDDNFPPYVFRDSAGGLQGIIIDQWRAWEKKTGVSAEISGMDWGEAVSRMKAGEFDVIDSVFETPERAKYLDFSKSYATIQVPIFFRATISGITDVASLRGFPVAAKTGDATALILQDRGISPLLLYNNYEAIITAARERKVNVFVVDKPPALYFLHKQGLETEFRMSEPITTGEFHRAVRKGNASLLQVIEKGFADVGRPEFARIEKKWFGQTLGGARYLRYLGYGVLGGGTLMVLLVGWNYGLCASVKSSCGCTRGTVPQLSPCWIVI